MAQLEQKENKETRPPVVAILGHIDHGKSTLIDYIKKTNVTGKEAGGITQHANAYEITRPSKGKRITFLDTPGHEAFTSIRTRCANIADIAVLVVSAEDGVKPQTLEVIKYIKECSQPYLVAITKMDKPAANAARVKQDLAENGVYVEGYGGDTSVVELSAVTGKGVDELLDMISLMAEMEGRTADREALGSGVIIESRLDTKKGVTAVGIIKNGTVRRSLFAASPGAIAPIRFILDAEGNVVEELSFSSPVQISGWNRMPIIGSEFRTFLKKEEALAFSKEGVVKNGQKEAGQKTAEGALPLSLVVKADTAGSLEVVVSELKKLSRERIMPKVISSGVGGVGENDVKSALATDGAVIIGFNVRVDSRAAQLAERSGIVVLSFNIIYELTDKVNELLSEREPKTETEEVAGSTKVLKLFSVAKGKQVIGGRVLSGTFRRNASVKIVRRETEIGRGKIRELQRSKVVVDSASEGEEFGAMIESKIEVAPGDIISAIELVTK